MPLLLLLLLLLLMWPQQEVRVRGRSSHACLHTLPLPVVNASSGGSAAVGKEHRAHKRPGMRLQLLVRARRGGSIAAAAAAGLCHRLHLFALMSV